ncbi:hypothetical protein N1851_012164 [Merluccius polli]|uniref:Uncharacterized protein n=1 Tax=Merluccius polli TaxID=89951 RepID=A0AA47P5A3_MERPO|nr:hypothetical protein N1851_012164 [Merluccius polli]
MSNYKHRRRTSKKLPSSSSGEDEKVTGGHRVSKDKNAKRQESGNNHDRPQQKECPPPSSKGKSNSHRHFKEAVYKLSKTQSSEQRPVENEVTGGHRVSKDKNTKRQESGNNHDRPQQKECPPPSSKDKSNSHRHFKEAVYKLSKTQSSEQRPVENEVGRNRTKTVCSPTQPESNQSDSGQCHTPTPPSPSVPETGGLGLLLELAEASQG